MSDPILMVPCEVCGLYEQGEHSDQVGDWCDGAGSRPATPSELIEALLTEGWALVTTSRGVRVLVETEEE